jgi:hypothetical protein
MAWVRQARLLSTIYQIKVNVYVGEAVVWYQNGGWLEVDVPVNLTLLAGQPRPGH